MKNSISIEINNSNHLPLITKDYVLKNNLKEFHSFENNIDNYSEQIIVRNNFSTEKRNSLVEVLLDQNKGFSKNIIDNILKLRDSKTFTVTTGHQLCLFTGPMYFIYKILQTIKLSKTLKQKYPENNFIPVYWMASDDHDFEEIKFFNSYQKKFTHEINSENLCTGDIKTENLEKVYRDLEIEFSNKKNVKQLLQIFKESYLSNKTYSSATRHLVYELFKDYDIVVLDPNEKRLKTHFKSTIIDEISNFSTYKIVSETVGKISETYQGKFKPQVNPRKVNLFYIENQKRFRIDFKNGLFKIFNKNYSKEDLLKIVESNPENFSPNVLLRPLYQESILPNLAYVGGGSEISYWLELKDLFIFYKIPFPILSLRCSLLLLNEKDIDQISRNNLSVSDFFEQLDFIEKKYISKKNTGKYNFINFIKEYNLLLDNQFSQLLKIDKNLNPILSSLKKRHHNDFDNLNKKIIKSLKTMDETSINQIRKLHYKIFPNGVQQERYINFSHFYSIMGAELIDKLFSVIDPFEPKYKVCVL